MERRQELAGPDGEQHPGSTDEEYPYGMNRRQWLKYFGAGGVTAGLTSLAGCAGNEEGDGGGGEDPEEEVSVPRDDDAFEDIELRWTSDNAAGPLYSMFGPAIGDESGVSFDDGEILPPDNYYSALNSEFVGGGDFPYDITLMLPLHLGDFQARELFEPLDPYLNKYEGMEAYLDSVIEPYREFYMKWNDNTVALPIDGDIHNLFYRPSFFNDEDHQEQYQDEYGEELQVPETWPEFNQVAKYFTENTEDGVYGTQVYGARPWNFGWWMDRAASRGVIYFDEEMEPQINSEDAVAALEHMVETTEYAPPNTDQLGVAETIEQWQQGNVVMSVWWIDLTEFTARGDFPVVGDQSAAAVPGWEQEDGSVRRNAMMLYNRLYAIPASLSDERKEAAFYAAMRISHPDYSVEAVADPFTGLDPFLEQHYTEDAAEKYTQPNPLRDTGEGFPKNVPIFSPDNEYPDDRSALDQALQHIKAGQVNMENGFPQPNWPGANQYIQDLSIHIQRALSGQESPQEALDNAAEKWSETVEELGREEQQQAYQDFLDTAKDLDYI
jgi:multiple sugar transport system substrate-binding protein